jgi:hypothetical protein
MSETVLSYLWKLPLSAIYFYGSPSLVVLSVHHNSSEAVAAFEFVLSGTCLTIQVHESIQIP